MKASRLFLFLCSLSGVLYNTVEISSPKITRTYKASTGGKSSQSCLIRCSVSDVDQALLSWYNGSDPLLNLTISPLNTRLYLEVDLQDQNSYSCKVSRSGVNQTSHLDKNRICLPCPETSMMPASEGECVTLSTHLQELHNEDVEWVYQDSYLIAKLYGQNDDYYDCDDGRFKDRQQLDFKTGSLTIKNISKIHSGTYEPKITDDSLMNGKCLTYIVNVYDSLPDPVISNDSTRCYSSSKCAVMCSVSETGGTLSWFNGSRVHSSISVSDLKRSNFLRLEVEYQDTNTYRCVVNNSFTNKTTQLNMSELCKADGSRGQYAVTYTAAQGNAGPSGGQQETSGTVPQDNSASGDVTPVNNRKETTRLIDHSLSSEEESLPLNTLCCTKSQ